MTTEVQLAQFMPELILLIGACATLALGATRTSYERTWVSGLTFVIVGLALIETVHQGAPTDTYAAFGLAVTPLAYYTRLIALSVGLLIVLVNWYQPAANERGEYMALVTFSLLGVLMTGLANDWLVLFFAIELVSVPTYVLIALSRLNKRASEASVKYFFLGALSAAILVYGLSFLYGVGGTTTILSVGPAGAASNMPLGNEFGPLALIGLLLVIGGLAFKVAAVPFHVYAPDVYEGAASPVTGMLGFVPKLAGFIALIKVMAAFHWDVPDEVLWVLWAIAALTMTVGNVLALLQLNVKRMLGYSSIAHTGYMMIALLVGPVAGKGPMHDGVTALLFYVAIYGAMNLGAFALLSAMQKGDNEMETLEDIAGIARRAPGATLALAVCVFSLMGFPPMAGFLGKLFVFSSAFSVPEEHVFHGPLIALAIIGVINSAIAAAYYLRIVGAAYMGTEVDEPPRMAAVPVRCGLALCALAMIFLFVKPSTILTEARTASGAIQTDILRDQQRTRAAMQASADGRVSRPVQPDSVDTSVQSHP